MGIMGFDSAGQDIAQSYSNFWELGADCAPDAAVSGTRILGHAGTALLAVLSVPRPMKAASTPAR
jgi:hypothetical protein